MYKLSIALISVIGLLTIGCGSSEGEEINAAPVFVSDYTVSYKGESDVVFQAQAEDSDGDEVTYALEGDDAKYFTIDAITGEVRFSLDAAVRELLEFDVILIASDGRYMVKKPAHVSGNPSDYAHLLFNNVFKEGYAVVQHRHYLITGNHEHYTDYIAVGSPKVGSHRGAVHIYKKDESGNVDFVRTLAAVDGEAGDSFGSSVAMDERFLIVGTPYDDEKGLNTGAAYRYEYNGTDDFLNVKKFTPQNPQVNDLFGYAMDMSGERLIVSVPGRKTFCGQSLSLATLVNKPPVLQTGGGGVYLFSMGDAIIQKDKVNTACIVENGDWFGKSVAIYADRVLIGAPYDRDKGFGAGAAYFYTINENGKFGAYEKIFAVNTNEQDHFGSSVDLEGGTGVVVGAPGALSPRNMQGIVYYGAAYVFAGNPLVERKIIYDTTQTTEVGFTSQFGKSVAIMRYRNQTLDEHHVIAVGAPGDDSSAENAGAVHLFESSGVDFQYNHIKKIVGSAIARQYVFGSFVSMFANSLVTGDGNVTAIYTETLE